MSFTPKIALLVAISIAAAGSAAHASVTWEKAASKSGQQHNAVLAHLQSQGPAPTDGQVTRDAFERMLSSAASYAVAELGADRDLTTKVLQATKNVMINKHALVLKKDPAGKTAQFVRYDDLDDLIDLLGSVDVTPVAARRLHTLNRMLSALGDSPPEDDVAGLVEAFVAATWSPSEKQHVAFFANVFEASSRYWNAVEAGDVAVSVRKPKGRWRKRLADAIGAFVGGVIGGGIGGPAGAGTGAAIGGAVASHLASG